MVSVLSDNAPGPLVRVGADGVSVPQLRPHCQGLEQSESRKGFVYSTLQQEDFRKVK